MSAPHRDETASLEEKLATLRRETERLQAEYAGIPARTGAFRVPVAALLLLLVLGPIGGCAGCVLGWHQVPPPAPTAVPGHG
jgi:hypothetical protein